MPPQQALQSLTQAFADNPAVNVLVAAEPGGGCCPSTVEFAARSGGGISCCGSDGECGGDVALRPYDPGYTPEWNELCYIDLAEHEEIARTDSRNLAGSAGGAFPGARGYCRQSPLLCDGCQSERSKTRGVLPDLQPEEGVDAPGGFRGAVQSRSLRQS